jgi:hypothetical protein
MSENNTTVTIPAETDNTSGKTFTQAELDEIIKDRLAREKGKYADYEELKAKATKFDEAEEAAKSELQKAIEKAEAAEAELNNIKQANALREMREKVASETGVPASLLTADTEEGCRALAQGINDFTATKTHVAPTVKDGGETTPPTVTKADIMAIKDEKKRLAAIRENIELFS